MTGKMFEKIMEFKIPGYVVDNLGLRSMWPNLPPKAAKAAGLPPENQVEVVFKQPGRQNLVFDVLLSIQSGGQRSSAKPQYRIKEDSKQGGTLQNHMRQTFVATYGRHMEAKEREKLTGAGYDAYSVESFHEFLDIEFDLAGMRMIWHPHFVLHHPYSNLFRTVASNPFVHQLGSNQHNRLKFPATDWEDYKINGIPNKPATFAPNVIYFLRCDVTRKVYIGQGGSGTSGGTHRIFSPHPSIPNPTHYRYDILPPATTTEMLDAVEEMQIRAFAYFLHNNPRTKAQTRLHVPNLAPGWTLVNRQIK